MSWDYRLSDRARKNLKRFPKSDQRRIFSVLEEIKADPFQGDVKPIQGSENVWRRRVGAYRIYFRPLHNGRILEIPEIGRKQSH